MVKKLQGFMELISKMILKDCRQNGIHNLLQVEEEKTQRISQIQK